MRATYSNAAFEILCWPVTFKTKNSSNATGDKIIEAGKSDNWLILFLSRQCLNMELF